MCTMCTTHIATCVQWCEKKNRPRLLRDRRLKSVCDTGKEPHINYCRLCGLKLVFCGLHLFKTHFFFAAIWFLSISSWLVFQTKTHNRYSWKQRSDYHTLLCFLFRKETSTFRISIVHIIWCNWIYSICSNVAVRTLCVDQSFSHVNQKVTTIVSTRIQSKKWGRNESVLKRCFWVFQLISALAKIKENTIAHNIRSTLLSRIEIYSRYPADIKLFYLPNRRAQRNENGALNNAMTTRAAWFINNQIQLTILISSN